MYPKPSKQKPFHPSFEDQLNHQHPLYHLAKKINWSGLEAAFFFFYCADNGRPAKPIRLMVGLLILKHIRNLSDENVVAQWEENSYYQYFCGELSFVPGRPCAPSDLVHFRHRIGKDGMELIFQESIRIQEDDIHHDKGEVVIDTTVQEKNITFPTDDKQRKKIIRKCIDIARKEGVELRQTYSRTVKKLSYQQRLRRTKAQQQLARRADRRIRTIAGRLVRDLKNKLSGAAWERRKAEIALFERMLAQKRQDKNKLYSLHEPHVECIAKGKQHKPYEFGSKTSFIIGRNSGIVLGAINIEHNDYDGHTLDAALDQFEILHGLRPVKAIVDLGYRGRNKVGSTLIQTPATPPNATVAQRHKLRKTMRRRAAIEATISHLKRDHRLNRNYYKGVDGDHYNVLLAAAAANFARWMRMASDLYLQFIEALGSLWRSLLHPLSLWKQNRTFFKASFHTLGGGYGVFKG